MRNAYLLLGASFLLVMLGTWYAFSRSSEVVNTTDSGHSPVQSMTSLTLSSPDFEKGGNIPAKFTCDGDEVNPALSISGVPSGAKSLVLIVDDPDVPKQLKPDGVFDHWTLYNIPPETTEVAQGSTGGTAGRNSAGKNAYVGPCPPKQYEPSQHRYYFRLYALDAELPLAAGATKLEVLKAMEGHIVGQAELMGKYKRP